MKAYIIWIPDCHIILRTHLTQQHDFGFGILHSSSFFLQVLLVVFIHTKNIIILYKIISMYLKSSIQLNHKEFKSSILLVEQCYCKEYCVSSMYLKLFYQEEILYAKNQWQLNQQSIYLQVFFASQDEEKLLQQLDFCRYYLKNTK